MLNRCLTQWRALLCQRRHPIAKEKKAKRPGPSARHGNLQFRKAPARIHAHGSSLLFGGGIETADGGGREAAAGKAETIWTQGKSEWP